LSQSEESREPSAMKLWESTYSHYAMVSARSRFLAIVWRRARPPLGVIGAKCGRSEDRSPGLGKYHVQGELSPFALEPTSILEWARKISPVRSQLE